MPKITISEFIAKLEEFKAEHGDVPMVWTDGVTEQYFQLFQLWVAYPHLSHSSVESPLSLIMRMEPTKAKLNFELKKLSF